MRSNESSVNLAVFREDLSRRRPAAFEVTATRAVAPLAPTRITRVAVDLGNAEHISPARLNPLSGSRDATIMRAIAQERHRT